MESHHKQSPEQFTRLLVANQRRIYGFVFTLVQEHAAADDLLQEVSVLLWQKFESFEPGTDFGAWAIAIARLKVLEWYRKQKRVPLPMESDLLHQLADRAEEAHAEPDVERRQALEECLSKLSDRDTELLSDRYSKGQPVSRIAQRIGRTRDAVYKVLARIHRDLADCVRGKLADPGRAS